MAEAFIDTVPTSPVHALPKLARCASIHTVTIDDQGADIGGEGFPLGGTGIPTSEVWNSLLCSCQFQRAKRGFSAPERQQESPLYHLALMTIPRDVPIRNAVDLAFRVFLENGRSSRKTTMSTRPVCRFRSK
jgi:hypothetical protein